MFENILIAFTHEYLSSVTTSSVFVADYRSINAYHDLISFAARMRVRVCSTFGCYVRSSHTDYQVGTCFH